MSLMLDRDYAPEAEHTEKESFGRTAARVLLLSVMVTALVAGLYMAFGGNSGTDPLAGSTAGNSSSGAPAAAAPAPQKPVKVELTYEQKAAKAAESLKGVSATERRPELLKYLKVVGIKVTAASSPATAATTACDLLGDGTKPQALINGVASGGEYTKAQSKAFLLGATTLYCPSYAKNFR